MLIKRTRPFENGECMSTEEKNGVIAFFTPEIAIDQQLPFYSGGLGVVSGDIARSARKLGVPMVVVTILPREGYYHQYVDGDKMGIRYERWENEKEFLDNTGLIIPINLNQKLNWIKVWKLKDLFSVVPVYFLDTDIDENDYLGRMNTRQLYGGSMHSGLSVEDLEKRKIAQCYILGKGGVKALRRLKITVRKYHLNEAHSYFAAQEILNDALKLGMSGGEAISHTKSKVVFTTHTPIAAGNPTFELNEMARISSINEKCPITLDFLKMLGGDTWGKFNMATACLRLAGKANAVSKKHLEVAKEMWGAVEGCAPLIAITNGVSQDFWQYPEFRNARTKEKFAEVKLKYKRKVIEKYNLEFDESVALLIWARRFAAYKRPRLIFYDLEWISNLLKTKKAQLIMAGKPHPDDTARIDDWNYLLRLSRSGDFPNFIMLPGYELEMMKELQAAADIWINTPRSPNEASGTSGMKANGAINVSTPDGWMCEANPSNCFLFGSYSPMPIEVQDKADAEAFKIAINNCLTSFYFNRDSWLKNMFDDTREKERIWTSDRALLEYQKELYDA